MLADVPLGSRPAARVLLINSQQQVLLLEAHDSQGSTWWIAPGGGLEPGETFEDAARREIEEETGIAVELGPCIWTRHHGFVSDGKHYDLYERFFVATSFEERSAPSRPDAYVSGSRWWSLAEIVASDATFAPRRLANLLPDIIARRYPSSPFDCGV